jgi:N-acetylneuraminic acid mutarotase
MLMHQLRRLSPSRKPGRLALEVLEGRDLPAPLAWAAGTNLPSARGGVVAVIQSNNVLVLGGHTTDTPLLTATNPTWQATVGTAARQDVSRVSPGVGVTPDGYVLLFGGFGQSEDSHYAALDSASQYVWNASSEQDSGGTSVASMSTPRALLGSATDENHNVYAIGGINTTGAARSSVEVYHQGTWHPLASLPQALYSESAVADDNGHVFAFGGVGAGGTITTNVYEYTIASNTWTTVAALPLAVRDSAAVLGPNGKIYVLGGTTSTGATASVESYDLSSGTWTTEASLPAAVSSEAAVVDPLGRIETLGGYDAGGHAVASVWISQELNQPDAAPAFTTNPPTATQTGAAYSYQVYSTANPQATYSLTTAPAGMTINPATGLIGWVPGVSQVGSATVTVQASNYAGQTTQSFTINVVASPPTVPTGLTVSGRTASSITLSWNASSDPAGVTSYTVYHIYATGHSGRGGGITIHHDPVATVTGTSATITGLAPSTTYLFAVRAFDGGGRSSGYSIYYNATTATLPSFTAPAAGTTFNLTARHAFTTTLTASGNPTDFSYSIVNAPAGMTVGATTGVVSWVPPDSAVGTTSVTFQVSSSAGTGGTATCNFAVAPNLPVPQVSSANLVNGALFATPTGLLKLQLFDGSSNSTVTWSLLSGPAKMTVNASTGLVTWLPPASTALGTINAVFQAANYAGTATLTVPIHIVFASAPVHVKVSGLTTGPAGDSATISWAVPATNAKQVVKYELIVTQPGGLTGRFSRTYTVSGLTRKYKLTGLDVSSLITVEVVAVDAHKHLGMPAFVSFDSP